MPFQCCPPPRAPRGFTLIELLVVVAIISILASIAVPNFLEAQTRAKVARAQSDLRALETALQTYRLDYNGYPVRRAFPDVPNITTFKMGDWTTRERDMRVLTTPVAYITRIPGDVFLDDPVIREPNNILEYWDSNILVSFPAFNNNAEGYTPPPFALLSVGPDGVVGQLTQQGRLPPPPQQLVLSYRFDYDPTNGTISGGNIYRFPGALTALQALK